MKELVYHRHLLPAVERYADKVGFVDGSYRATYARHIDRVGRLCAALDSLGVGRADRSARPSPCPIHFSAVALERRAFREGTDADETVYRRDPPGPPRVLGCDAPGHGASRRMQGSRGRRERDGRENG
jgi:hypothetical protein